MPSKQQMQRWLDKTWFYSKVILFLSIFGLINYSWGTFNPNNTAKAKVNAELAEREEREKQHEKSMRGD